MEKKKIYAAIDLKSFYASVECVARGLDPLSTNLLVADVSKTEKTICLAVTPSLKAHGISGRARLFEAVQQVKIANALRKAKLRGKDFTGSSYDDNELKKNSSFVCLLIYQSWETGKWTSCGLRALRPCPDLQPRHTARQTYPAEPYRCRCGPSHGHGNGQRP